MENIVRMRAIFLPGGLRHSMQYLATPLNVPKTVRDRVAGLDPQPSLRAVQLTFCGCACSAERSATAEFRLNPWVLLKRVQFAFHSRKCDKTRLWTNIRSPNGSKRFRVEELFSCLAGDSEQPELILKQRLIRFPRLPHSGRSRGSLL